MKREEVRVRFMDAVNNLDSCDDFRSAKDTDRFVQDLGLDSLDTIELLMAVESAFNIAIPDEDAERISTLGEALDYLHKNQAKIPCK